MPVPRAYFRDATPPRLYVDPLEPTDARRLNDAQGRLELKATSSAADPLVIDVLGLNSPLTCHPDEVPAMTLKPDWSRTEADPSGLSSVCRAHRFEGAFVGFPRRCPDLEEAAPDDRERIVARSGDLDVVEQHLGVGLID